MFNITEKIEFKIITISIISYWWLFWLFNVIDKIIGKGGYLFEGKDRLTAFIHYFELIGINNPIVASGTLWFISIVEFIALVLFTLAIYYWWKERWDSMRGAIFFGIIISLFVFSFFAVGDQIFGDRKELWEHTSYWTGLIVSWMIFIQLKKQN